VLEQILHGLIEFLVRAIGNLEAVLTGLILGGGICVAEIALNIFADALFAANEFTVVLDSERQQYDGVFEPVRRLSRAEQNQATAAE